MTPLGYLPLADAIQRCAEAWKVDRKSAWDRLRPYLHCGQVYSCTIGASGSMYEADRQWGAERNERADETGFLLYARLYDDGFTKQKAFVEEASLGALLSESLSGETGNLGAGESHEAVDQHAHVSATKGRRKTKVPTVCAWLESRYPGGIPDAIDAFKTLNQLKAEGILVSKRSLVRALAQVRAPNSAK